MDEVKFTGPLKEEGKDRAEVKDYKTKTLSGLNLLIAQATGCRVERGLGF